MAELRRAWVLGFVLAASPCLAAATEPAGSQETAAPTDGAAHDAGLRAYERGDFREAMVQFERAYASGEAPADLYGWAQAARNAAQYSVAIALYRRFIDLGMEGDSRTAAESNIARCEEQLAAAEPEPEASPTVSPIISAPRPITHADPVDQPRPHRREQRPDPLAVILLSTGGAATIAGAVIVGVGEVRRSTQGGTTEYREFDNLDGQIDRLHIAGGVALGVGVALATAGIVRLVLRRKRRGAAKASTRPVGRWAWR
ncbi:MAG: hypothetical protein JKY37_10010 [Nannocystaceae bacterium]|nr:hypothetical protein [Nannocystaceae bacterium]